MIAILRSCLVGIKAEGESGGQGQKNDKSNLQSWKKIMLFGENLQAKTVACRQLRRGSLIALTAKGFAWSKCKIDTAPYCSHVVPHRSTK